MNVTLRKDLLIPRNLIRNQHLFEFAANLNPVHFDLFDSEKILPTLFSHEIQEVIKVLGHFY